MAHKKPNIYPYLGLSHGK